MKKIKDFYLSALNENKEEFFHLDKDSVGKIENINLSKDDNFIKIDFATTYGKPMSIVVNYDDFMIWYKKHKEQGEPSMNIFKDYISKYIVNAKETEPFFQSMNEIIGDDGNIMASDDLPSNANNRMVGAGLKWDLEKVYKQSVPKGIRFFSGDMGIGIISW